MTIDLLVLGGAHIDRRGMIAGETVPGASNPGAWKEEAGGGGFNAARALARLGFAVTMISPRGGDALGGMVAQAARMAEVDDRPFTFLDRVTPSYTAILERDGNLVIALADMELYRLFTPRRLKVRAVREALDEARLILVDANLPEDTLEAIAREAARLGKPLAGIGISPAKVVRYRNCLDRIDYLFLNAAEAAVLAGKTAPRPEDWPYLLQAQGLRGGVVTQGAGAVTAFGGKEAFLLHPPRLETIADVTGAGDALAAGTLSALIKGENLGTSLRHGVALAGLTLLSPEAVVADLSPDRLSAQLVHIDEPRRLLLSSADLP
ncbi:carbohydrate kinase family protein [Allorhizobium sp. BGMRC 0089]|uniref:carbohydrate kinase family protein n=1 Tax=Allorhizobium sonneratiae TaxID=2934936 RepID=UPI002033C015|nr:carbohydrate kinase family protein [Allorhizobium sonneratiae]MCM2292934.1 carbohydrate kinase family protein [Allorhizobium sonneratiae]